MSRTRLVTTVACVLLVLAYGGTQALLDADLVDDTYIFLRYAQNLCKSQGLVFNAGERVEGYTSPLWVLCLGGLGKLHLNLATSSKTLSALFGVTTVLMLLVIGQKRLSPGGESMMIIPAWFLATNPSFAYWTWSGMDTSIFTFAFLASFLSFLAQVESAGTMTWSGVWFLLAAFARLDMLSVLPVYLLFILYLNRHRGRLLVRKCVSFLAPLLLLLLHFLWRYHYYGSFLPNIYYTKTSVPMHVLLKSGITYGAQFALAYAPHLAAAFLAILVLARALGKLPTRWKVSLAVMGVWGAYITCVGGDHFAMFRFYVPVLPILAFSLAPVVIRLIRSSHMKGVLSLVGALAVLALSLSILNYSVYRFHGGERAKAEVQLARSWSQVGQWFRRNVPHNARIASLAVGAIPYYAELATYDLLGLTDREVATRGQTYLGGRIGHQKYNTNYILAQRPDYIVYHTSGRFTEPRWQRGEDIDKEYSYALYDLVNDDRTGELYEYRAVKMANGKWIEFLQLKESSH